MAAFPIFGSLRPSSLADEWSQVTLRFNEQAPEKNAETPHFSLAYNLTLCISGVKRGVIVADKGFPASAAAECRKECPGLHYLNPVRPTAKNRNARLKTTMAHGILRANASPVGGVLPQPIGKVLMNLRRLKMIAKCFALLVGCWLTFGGVFTMYEIVSLDRISGILLPLSGLYPDTTVYANNWNYMKYRKIQKADTIEDVKKQLGNPLNVWTNELENGKSETRFAYTVSRSDSHFRIRQIIFRDGKVVSKFHEFYVD